MKTNEEPTQKHYSGQRSVETEIELLWARVKTLEGKFEKTEDDKGKALMWGVRTLGTLLLALGAYVANLITTGKH